ncbi:hypothetical protein SAMN05216268_1059 [Streptomyces yunnanensis]|uniref:Uncharacterized protein n=1 Tax=Streptomyces yunnanensis TaxID=156453 RepID=A0A9X8MRG9_9ACTN|nr:hypothetical protein SAMN05216268_1059 [Streptomyces yunnanensis]
MKRRGRGVLMFHVKRRTGDAWLFHVKQEGAGGGGQGRMAAAVGSRSPQARAR